MTQSRSKTAKGRKSTDAVLGRDGARLRNRESILTAAHALFRERGYETVTIRDIAAHSNLGLGTFYNYFEDKEEVFRSLLEARSKERLREQRRQRLAAKNFPDFIETQFRVFFHEVCEDPEFFEMFTRKAGAILEFFSFPYNTRAYNDLREDLATLVNRGILAPLDTEIIAITMRALNMEFGTYLVRQTPPDPEAMTQLATRILLHGLPWQPEKGPRPAKSSRR